MQKFAKVVKWAAKAVTTLVILAAACYGAYSASHDFSLLRQAGLQGEVARELEKEAYANLSPHSFDPMAAKIYGDNAKARGKIAYKLVDDYEGSALGSLLPNLGRDGQSSYEETAINWLKKCGEVDRTNHVAAEVAKVDALIAKAKATEAAKPQQSIASKATNWLSSWRKEEPKKIVSTQ